MKSVWASAAIRRMLQQGARKTSGDDAWSLHHTNPGHIVVVEGAMAV